MGNKYELFNKLDKYMDDRFEDNDQIIKWCYKGLHADSMILVFDKAGNTFFVEWSSEYGDLEYEEFQISEFKALMEWIESRI